MLPVFQNLLCARLFTDEPDVLTHPAVLAAVSKATSVHPVFLTGLFLHIVF